MPETEWKKPRLPDRLERILAEKAETQPGARCWIRTDAKCTNRRIGSLLVRYLFREVSVRERQRFEEHVRSCIACAATVHDAFELRRDLESRRSHDR